MHLLTSLLILLLLSPAPKKAEETLVMFWNVENFFDYTDDGTGVSDNEFSSEGSRHWTKKRFYEKCNKIAKAVMAASDHCGRMPDVIALAEVENARVLKQLIYGTSLQKFAYTFVHYDSPDTRGIDCALLYRKTTMSKVGARACHVRDSGGKVMRTRDILQVTLKDKRGKLFGIMVNHHPSKLGNGGADKRRTAMRNLREVADSLDRSGCHRFIAVGDFNDQIPEFSCTEKIKGMDSAPGTIKYHGVWEKIDGCALVKGLKVREEIFAPAMLTTKDSQWAGQKPLRTYNGPRFAGGVSDHYPVLFFCR